MDGELDEATAARVRRHLRHCRRCARVERSLRRVVRGLHELSSLPPPVTVDPGFDGVAGVGFDRIDDQEAGR